ncbi:MAG: helix-turn-helix protein [Mucilaginibacter sp.]|nr:helix-turn-helix protein [Mucilaginibacter sp.]
MLRFYLYIMLTTETLEEFYQRHPVANQKVFAENNTGQGHFNVFLRRSCNTRSPFSRRDFYKIALIIGNGKIHYADKWVTIDRPALVFSSPTVPSSWEPGPGSQDGWFCLFTQSFIESHEHKSALKEFPLFQADGCHIVFLTDVQLAFMSATLGKMLQEMESDYVHKYDLLRSYLRILMHEALKIAPVTTYETNTNAAARITGLFFELLERQFPIDSPGQYLKLKTAHNYAQSLAVHTNHLNRSVKEVTGKTTTQHVSERVLKEAYALLKHTDWTIAQIANSLGFEEPAYFANFFKKYTGSSPLMSRLGVQRSA